MPDGPTSPPQWRSRRRSTHKAASTAWSFSRSAHARKLTLRRTDTRALLDNLDLRRRQVEQVINTRIELRLKPHDLGRARWRAAEIVRRLLGRGKARQGPYCRTTPPWDPRRRYGLRQAWAGFPCADPPFAVRPVVRADDCPSYRGETRPYNSSNIRQISAASGSGPMAAGLYRSRCQRSGLSRMYLRIAFKARSLRTMCS